MNIVQYFGNFHPLLVHLPIGILIIGLLLVWKARIDQTGNLLPAIRLILLAGALSATFSALTGYLIYLYNDYDPALVQMHQWLGFGLTALSWAAYGVTLKKDFRIDKRYLGLIMGMALILLFTGHAGGTLTHGSEFLTPPAFSTWFEKPARSAIQLDSNSTVYDAVSMILNNKCYSCHGQKRQRGALRLDAPEFILAGGEDGSILKAGQPYESSLLLRLLLPEEEEEHMPPRERAQLTQEEISLIHWWIADGASFEIKLTAANLPDSLRLPTSGDPAVPSGPKYHGVPEDDVQAAQPEDLAQLKAAGVIILPVSEESNYLSANFINVRDSEATEIIKKLVPIAPQLIWLKLSGKPFDDTGILTLSELTNLRRLSLDHTGIDDNDLISLFNLKDLQYLNLAGTNVSAEGLKGLSHMPKLQSLYISNTRVEQEELPNLKASFPSVDLVFVDFSFSGSDSLETTSEL